MGKITALDLGDQWVGTALSDTLHLLARPYQTVQTSQLHQFLQKLFSDENIERVIVGYPRTMKGHESEQTNKVKVAYDELVRLFPTMSFILWDERLSSKRAESLSKKPKSLKDRQDAKKHSHSQAAAFILDSYLSYQAQIRHLDGDQSDHDKEDGQ